MSHPPVATYDYRSQTGELLYQVVRFKSKRFRQRRPDGKGGWLWNVSGVQQVPYCLPGLAGAPAGEWIFIVEGEKDVDNLYKAGVIATCNAMGAGKWRASLNKWLAGRKVCILPDNDEAGRKHANQVAGSLLDVAEHVCMVELPDLAPKGDVSDWLAAGGSRSELLALAELAPSCSGAPEWEGHPEGAQAGDPEGSPANGASVDDLLLNAGKHDEGNAQVAYHLYGDRVAFCDALGWLYRGETHWDSKRGRAKARDAVVSALQQRCQAAIWGDDLSLLSAAKPSARRVKDALYLFERLVTVDKDEFDKEPYLLNCANGVVDLRTGELAAHEASNRFSYCVDTPYVPDAWQDGLYHKLMFQWFDGDLEKISVLQRSLGYSITGETREECMFLLTGPGRSGKGTIVNTVLALLGNPLVRGAEFSVFTNVHNDPQNFRLASFWNARMIVASEGKKDQVLNVARSKLLTGRDTVQVAFKNRPSFDLVPRFKIWLMTNYLPKGDPDDDAFWWRVRLIRLQKSYMQEPDLSLKDRLLQAQEREATLSWLVYGATAWRRLGLGRPRWMEEDICRVRTDLDPLQRFLADVLLAMPGDRVDLSELYTAYDEWCEDEGIEKRYRLAKNTVSRRLGEKGYELTRERYCAEGRRRKRVFVENVRLEW